jgi:hypothetical protein
MEVIDWMGDRIYLGPVTRGLSGENLGQSELPPFMISKKG